MLYFKHILNFIFGTGSGVFLIFPFLGPRIGRLFESSRVLGLSFIFFQIHVLWLPYHIFSSDGSLSWQLLSVVVLNRLSYVLLDGSLVFYRVCSTSSMSWSENILSMCTMNGFVQLFLIMEKIRVLIIVFESFVLV